MRIGILWYLLAIVIFFLMIPGKSKAEEYTSFNFGYRSYHFEREGYKTDFYDGESYAKQKYNEKNTGFGVEKNEYGFQYYKNSFDKNSYMVYKFFPVGNMYSNNITSVNFGLQVGIVSGYDFIDVDLIPYILPRLDIDVSMLRLSTLFFGTGLATSVNFVF